MSPAPAHCAALRCSHRFHEPSFLKCRRMSSQRLPPAYVVWPLVNVLCNTGCCFGRWEGLRGQSILTSPQAAGIWSGPSLCGTLMSNSKLELLNLSGKSSSPAICPEIAHYRKKDVFSWTPCYKIFMPCLWLYKVFCCVGHLLSKMFPYVHNLLKSLWSFRAGEQTALQNETLSGLMPE